MSSSRKNGSAPRRVVVIGGHTRSIGKTQLVCDVISAFPQVYWIAGKITQYGHGVCAQNGDHCDCAPAEHACAVTWESQSDSGTDTARFLRAGAQRSFWLRTKQGFLAEGLPLLRIALEETLGNRETDPPPLIVESNSLLQYVRPSLYIAVLDPGREDFKDSARAALDRADALVFRCSLDALQPASLSWTNFPARLVEAKPSVVQREGEPLPGPLHVLVQRALEAPADVSL